MKRIVILIVAWVELATMISWSMCRDFNDFLNLSSVNLTLHLEDLVHTDKGMAPHVVRIFHNKIIDFLSIILKKYLLFWDTRFLPNMISIIGYFGLACGFYYLVSSTKKKWYHWSFLVVLLMLPFVQIKFEPHLNFMVKIFLIFTPYILLSFFGIWKFLSHDTKWRYLVVTILILISICWMIVMKNEILHYCVKI